MASRFPSRLLIAAAALGRLASSAPMRLFRSRQPPAQPRRILIAHQLLLGDTIMLSALLARLREKYPQAEIVMTCAPAQLGLYSARPWGVKTLAYDERSVDTLWPLLSGGGYDLALIPAESRLSLLVAAIGAKWVKAFAGDKPAYKNWLIDELQPFFAEPAAWGDMAAGLADAQAPQRYRRGDWPAPAYRPFAAPPAPYCVLHVGASTRLKHWSPERWRALLAELRSRGLEIALTCGAGEAALIAAIDVNNQALHYPGTLDLPQLWHLLSGARLVVSLDTGIAHIARIVGAPLVVLYGPGSAQIFGGGNFFSAMPERQVFIPDFFCRDENVIFRRYVAWAKTCGRTTRDCAEPKCMQAIETDAVLAAIHGMLNVDSGQLA